LEASEKANLGAMNCIDAIIAEVYQSEFD